MSVDIYSPRVLIEANRQIKPVRTFLRDTFFSAQRTYRVENIDIDQQVKGRRVAPFVNKWGQSPTLDRLGFTTLSDSPPCIALKTVVTAQDTSNRVMGESLYENRDPAARARDLLADDLMELQAMFARREEMMVRDVLFNSAVVCDGLDTKKTYTFTRDSDLSIGTLGGSAAWTHADSDPLAKIDEWLELFARETGRTATDMILGGTAYRTFLDNVKVKAKMVNTSLIQTGVIQPDGIPDGARLVGTLYGGAFRLWTYHEWYDDPDANGATTDMVPAKKILIGAKSSRTERRYGAVQDLEGDGDNAVPTLREAVNLPRSWVEKNPPARYLELRSRPLPVPIENFFLTAQVQA